MPIRVCADCWDFYRVAPTAKGHLDYIPIINRCGQRSSSSALNVNDEMFIEDSGSELQHCHSCDSSLNYANEMIHLSCLLTVTSVFYSSHS